MVTAASTVVNWGETSWLAAGAINWTCGGVSVPGT
jgi:hypothetical protein